MKGLPSLQSLLFELEKLPGVGPRSARRLAEYPEFALRNLKELSVLDLWGF